ncbi:MAG: helix-turn-helix domain-containing protein, partial [Candidatus Heimdallarchaeota archaeon]|nr:helix-turn-helix domain-containing protein [Candidatus Heimdallarchaeota archaeon]
ELETSHLPVILLTAKSNLEAKLEGLNIGADAFIEKPFSIRYLRAHIISLLDNREKLRVKFAQQPFIKADTVIFSKTDENFVNSVTEIIDKNLSHTEFSTEELAENLYISRSSLHKKIKGITGFTPNDFIRLIRLKKAAELLVNNDYRINEICYMVGFNTPSYFAKCFQNQFGVLPKDFKVKHN